MTTSSYFKYAVIVGSNAFGLNLPRSDLDVVYVGEPPNECVHDRMHLMKRTTEDLISATVLQTSHPESLEWIFPAQFYGDKDVSNFVLEVRDSIVYGCRKWVWDRLWANANALALHAEHYYNTFPKRLAYSTMRFNTLFQYASGSIFLEAFRPDEKMKNILLAIRNCEIPIKDALRINAAAREKALTVQKFYGKSNDMVLQHTIRDELRNILSRK